jgi:hypothetical protein
MARPIPLEPPVTTIVRWVSLVIIISDMEFIQSLLWYSGLCKPRIPGRRNGEVWLRRIPGRRQRWVRLFFGGFAACHVLILKFDALVPP